MSVPLEGIRVVELAQVWAVPGAGMYLADQGADVIKVEPPWGDEARRLLTASPLRMKDGSTMPRHFLPLNRNKRSIVVDMTKQEGLEIIYRLVKVSDVFLHNLRPAAIRKLKLDYDTLSEINPRLVYLDFYPYGSKGPLSSRPAYDRLVQAYSGVHGRRTLPDGTPLSAGVWVADCATPILIAYGVALALLCREKTGRGQKVETSLLAGALAMQSMDLVMLEGEEKSPPKSLADQAVFSPYRCADNRYMVPIIVKDDEWQRFCRALGIEHLADDPLFATSQARADNSEVLFSLLDGVISTKTRDEWAKLMEEHDVPSAPILLPHEVFDHPQMVQNELIIEVDDPRIGKVKMLGYLLKLSGGPPSVRRPAPLLGEHTEQVLKETGYSEEEIRALRMKGVIG